MIEHCRMRYRYTFNPEALCVYIRTGGRGRICILTVSVLLFALFLFAEPSPAVQGKSEIIPSQVTSSTYFPCFRCHQDGIELESKNRDDHESIRAQGHPGKQYDCFSCHDREDLNKLRLFDGSRIDLEDSSQLCGQCHSTNYTLWESRLHGKINGTWNGEKNIVACAHCHDPHDPVFPAQIPKPPPTPPEKTLRWRK